METDQDLRTRAEGSRGAARYLPPRIFLIFLFYLVASPLQAATFVVTKTADTSDGTCNSDCSLREAIEAANIAATNDVIEFDPTAFPAARTITLTSGILDISNNGSLTINGTGADKLKISGNGSSGIFAIQPQATATINALTVADGNTSGNGGGIWNNGGNLTLDGIAVQDNVAGLGGGILNNATLTINNSVISRNRAAGVGGGIYNFFSGTLTIVNSRITGNSVTDGIGGGLANGGLASLTGTTLSGNSAGVVVTSDGGMGGGIFTGVGTMILTSSTLQNNSAVRGGGIATRGGSISLVASSLSNNSAGSGGGICNGCSVVDNGGATISLTNSTISGNSAYASGGGIFNNGLNAVNLSYCTISANAAPTGGGVLNQPSGTVNSRASIFGDNTTTVDPKPDFQGTLSSQGYNLVENTGGTTIVGTTAGNVLGQDPKLGALSANGGPTITCRLRVGSPAIDAADGANFPATDQRGVIRPIDGDRNSGALPDIGAFERSTIADSPFDFDADGKTDIAIFRPSVAEWWINKSSDGNILAAQFGAGTDRIAPGDFTGDGKTDIAVWRPSSGSWFILRSEDFSFYSFPFGTVGDVPVPADYDADGKADACVFRPSTFTWFIQRSTGGTHIEPFGAAGDLPVAADYDSDGKTDIAIYRPSLGQWWIQRSTAGLIAATFGVSTDKPVPGDYTGDLRADMAFFRPSTGEWFVLRSEDMSYFSFPWGNSTDLPGPGDYDGDGRFDAAVFRPSQATWYINRSTAGVLIQRFGSSGDRPVAGSFVP